MNKTLTILMAAVISAGAIQANAQFVERRERSTELSQALKSQDLIMHEGASLNLYWNFDYTNTDWAITGANQVYFRWGPTNGAFENVVTGSVASANAGQILIPFGPTDTATNGVYRWYIQVASNGVDVLTHPYGRMQLVAKLGGGGSTTGFTVGTNVDLSTYTFLNYPWLDGTQTTNMGGDITGHITNNTAAAGITRDAEWDTLSEINAASTDTDAVLDTDIGATVQAYDADLDDLADGTLSASKLDAAVTRDIEWDTLSEINAASTDTDAWAADGSVTGVAGSVHNFSGGTLSNVAKLVVDSLLSRTNIALHMEGRNSAGAVSASYRATPSGALIAVAASGDSITLQQGEASATLKMTNGVTDIVDGEFHIGGESIGFADGAANEAGDPIDYSQIKNVPASLFNIGAGAESDPTVAGATNALDVALRALTNTAGSVNNSGSTFIQDAILDANGNITNWVSAAAGGGADLQAVTASGATTDIKLTLTNDLMLVSNIVDTAGHKILAATDGAQAIYYDGGSVMFIDLGTSYQMKWQTGPTFMDLGTTFSMYDSAGNVFMDLGSGTEGLYFNNGLIAIDLGITNHIATTNGVVLVDLKTGLITNATVALATGATVNEFSIDGTLAGDSDAAVPTEKAVKTYVDGHPGTGITNVVQVSVTGNVAMVQHTALEMPFHLEESDDDGVFANNDWTPNGVGWCRTDVTAKFNNLDDGTYYNVFLRKNGADFRMIAYGSAEGYAHPAGSGGVAWYNDATTNAYNIWVTSADAAPILAGNLGTTRPVATFWRYK